MSETHAQLLHELSERAQRGGDGFLRTAVTAVEWQALGAVCAAGDADLSALWIDGEFVRMALLPRTEAVKLIVSLHQTTGDYPSIGRLHPPARRLERAMRDLYGVEPTGLGDDRAWLDHGVWPAADGKPGEKHTYTFLPVEGEGLHQIPVGPVHAGIIEPGHFRFTANGETIVRLEQRLGYMHKGVEALFPGKSLAEAARLIGRISGDSTVAYAFGFSLAIEAALGIEVPARAVALRGIMAEIERISHHINDFGAVCNDASMVAIQAHCSLLRERILQFNARHFGHRMLMDRVIPGGVAADLPAEGVDELLALLARCRNDFENAVHVYDSSPSLLDRTVTTGITLPEYVRQFAAGGFVGRASGRDFDTRRDLPYAPYDRLQFDVPLRNEGDVNARLWIRVLEVKESCSIIHQLVQRLQPGAINAPAFEPKGGEGAALVEAFRGDLFVSVRLDERGRLAHCHARDASWFQWPLLENAVKGNIVADFPLCNKSFNCSYSGPDL